jgi:quercetin dioxygenase-like cupin family protein
MNQVIPPSNVIPVPPAHSLTYDGATLNIFHVNKGEGLPAHNHLYAHATMCMAGSCMVRKDGKEVFMNKDTQPINLVAIEWHEIEALEDGTVFANMFAEGKY